MSVCPKGHPSASGDYCDECGAPMGASSVSAPHPCAPCASCPECSMERGSGARFCEVCQHDFQLGVGGASAPRVARSDAIARVGLAELGASAPQSSPPPASSTTSRPGPERPPLQLPLLARIHADPALSPDDESRAAFPPDGISDRIFHLDLDENMVGRDSPSKNAHPEISLRDPGASRRHLKIARIGGVFHALELGSANGTLLDGTPLEPGVPAPLRLGSSLRLGIWTTIIIEAR